jgi:hypothetical protein
MNKAVQKPVRSRYEAVQADEAPKWAPRDDGKSALLVSERAAVFDRPSAALAPVDPVLALSDPIWPDHGGATWTPDLVHARLLLTGEIVKRMPSPIRRGLPGVLGSIAVGEVSAPTRRPLTPQEITIADWTLVEIMARAHRQVLIASAFGFSGDKIAEVMQASGRRISGSTVQSIYLSERRIMAGQWQAKRVDVDPISRQRWEEIFNRRPK